jgi:GTP pyrophosphokinase
MPHSRTQVNKAGRTLRRAMRGELISQGDIDSALAIVEDYRAAHQASLTTATMGLRSMVSSEGCRLQVSQRLKRRETILDKIVP